MKYFESIDSNGIENYLFPLEDGSFIAIPKEQLEFKPLSLEELKEMEGQSISEKKPCGLDYCPQEEIVGAYASCTTCAWSDDGNDEIREDIKRADGRERVDETDISTL